MTKAHFAISLIFKNKNLLEQIAGTDCTKEMGVSSQCKFPEDLKKHRKSSLV